MTGLAIALFELGAIVIKLAYEGFDPARTLSSRLSTTATILVAALPIPGWVGYDLGFLWFLKQMNKTHTSDEY
jgi:hypothetical protein